MPSWLQQSCFCRLLDIEYNSIPANLHVLLCQHLQQLCRGELVLLLHNSLKSPLVEGHLLSNVMRLGSVSLACQAASCRLANLCGNDFQFPDWTAHFWALTPAGWKATGLIWILYTSLTGLSAHSASIL